MRIVYCHCAYANIVPKDVKESVLRHLAESEMPFDAVADLCEMSARRDPALADAAAGPTVIAACYPRAVKWLFNAAGAPLPAEGVHVLNMRTESAAEIVQSIERLRASGGAGLRAEALEPCPAEPMS